MFVTGENVGLRSWSAVPPKEECPVPQSGLRLKAVASSPSCEQQFGQMHH
jgi:hypothetical protein